MTKTILYSENNYFSINLFKNKKVKNKLNLKCIIASDNGIQMLQESFKNTKIIRIENFSKSNVNFLEKVKKNLLDEANSEVFSKIESECIKFLDFVNPNQNKFSLIEARQTFSDNLVFILDFIDYFKPEIIIFTNSPHCFQSHLLYKVCEIKKIKVIFKREISLPQNYIFQNSIKNAYLKLKINNKKENFEIRKELSNYIKAILKKDKKKINKIFSRLRNHKIIYNRYYLNSYIFFSILRIIHLTPIIFIKFLRDLIISFKNKNKSFLILEDFIKKKNITYNNSKTSKLNMNIELLLGDLRKFKLLKYYKKKQTDIELNCKYIYFPLHYQPEATTYPFGGAFIDQIKAIRLLSAYFTDCKILIKEHPDTFNISHLAWTKGDYSRNENFYDQISQIKNVHLVDLRENSLDLIDKAHGIATISGAVGLEGLLRGKHTIVFGYPWYEKFGEIFKFDRHEKISSDLNKYMKKKISVSKTIKDINLFSENIFKIDRINNKDERIVNIFLESIKSNYENI